MHSHEHHHEHEADPRLLERHLKGLRKTTQDIKDFRMLSRMGSAGIHDNSHAHAKHRDFRQDFAGVAEQFIEKTELDPDAHMYASLLSVIPGMLKAKQTLDHGATHRQQHYTAKMQMIKFMDSLRGIADSHPSLDPEILTHLVKAATLEYGYNAGAVNAAAYETRKSSRGIMHELGVEAELYWLPEEFEILRTDDVDDKNGADFKVLYRPTDTVVDIDVKASQETADNAIDAEKDYQYYAGHPPRIPKGKLILYSGFTKEDFEPHLPWRVKPEAIQREYPRIEALIRQAAGDETAPVPQEVR